MKQIVFTEPRVANLLDEPVCAVSGSLVKVKTAFTTISPGTERANLIGSQNVSWVGGDAVFPCRLGYSASGTVVEIGETVKNIKVGDRVAMYWSKHAEYNVLDENNLVKLPDTVPFDVASMLHIATFPLAALRKTRPELGESVLVMGLGLLGQLAVKIARAWGLYPIIAVDPIPERREEALSFGADYAIDPYEEGFAERARALAGGGANIAIEVTGVGAGLNGALDCMARFGRVALLGCTRDSDFTVDYYKKVHGPGISLIGAHTNARPKSESYPTMFTTRDDMKTLADMMCGRRITLDEMIREVHAPDECTEVFARLAEGKKFPIVVQFDWSKL